MSYAVQRLPQWFQILATARSDDANDQDLRWYWPPEGRYLRRTRRRCSRRPTRGLLSFRVQAYEEDQARVLTPRQKRTRSWNILRECARFRRTSSTSKLLDLPAEVRTMIWRYAAGGRHLAIFRDNRRLTHCLLDGDNSKRPGELFSISPLAIPIATRNICGNFYKPPQPPKSRILALMRTCRTVYVSLSATRKILSLNSIQTQRKHRVSLLGKRLHSPTELHPYRLTLNSLAGSLCSHPRVSYPLAGESAFYDMRRHMLRNETSSLRQSSATFECQTARPALVHICSRGFAWICFLWQHSGNTQTLPEYDLRDIYSETAAAYARL
jgi:hypothetical protein